MPNDIRSLINSMTEADLGDAYRRTFALSPNANLPPPQVMRPSLISHYRYLLATDCLALLRHGRRKATRAL